jgi:hypothetical protein
MRLSFIPAKLHLGHHLSSHDPNGEHMSLVLLLQSLEQDLMRLFIQIVTHLVIWNIPKFTQT